MKAEIGSTVYGQVSESERQDHTESARDFADAQLPFLIEELQRSCIRVPFDPSAPSGVELSYLERCEFQAVACTWACIVEPFGNVFRLSVGIEYRSARSH